MSTLFDSFKLGGITLPNRMVMAPLTRGRASAGGVPNALMTQYYTQRATAGLIVSEATPVSRQGAGWLGAPGIFTDAQEAGWKPLVEAVHRAGGRMYLQLWHMGRVVHPDFLDGELPVSSSALAAPGGSKTPHGKKDYVTPRALETNEIPGIVADFAQGAERAKRAGFDGVEIHSANGYLLDQFLRDGVNQRKDQYGGSVENRARLLKEVVQAITQVWDPGHVGVRISPKGAYNGMSDSEPLKLFSHVAVELNALKVGYLHVFEGLPGHWAYAPGEVIHPSLRKLFQGALILNGGYDAKLGGEAVTSGESDLIAYGVPFLANPDLVERYRNGSALNTPDPETFYSHDREGYVDYPTLDGKIAV